MMNDRHNEVSIIQGDCDAQMNGFMSNNSGAFYRHIDFGVLLYGLQYAHQEQRRKCKAYLVFMVKGFLLRGIPFIHMGHIGFYEGGHMGRYSHRVDHTFGYNLSHAVHFDDFVF